APPRPPATDAGAVVGGVEAGRSATVSPEGVAAPVQMCGWHRRDHAPTIVGLVEFSPITRCTSVAFCGGGARAISSSRLTTPYHQEMITPEPGWERRIADLWASFDDHEPADFLARMKELTEELPVGNAIALYELASAHDSIGNEAEAAAHYREALAGGLAGKRRREATIQFASTLRNLGRAEESVALLTAERDAVSDELDDALTAFLALALTDLGREREAASLALDALSRHLPQYNRSLSNYAKALVQR
ncbi:tetratricopeptide repeat protein, partial [Actinomadura welshii]